MGVLGLQALEAVEADFITGREEGVLQCLGGREPLLGVVLEQAGEELETLLSEAGEGRRGGGVAGGTAGRGRGLVNSVEIPFFEVAGAGRDAGGRGRPLLGVGVAGMVVVRVMMMMGMGGVSHGGLQGR